MIPTIFFASSKHPSNPNLSIEEEAKLNQIFCELHAYLKERVNLYKEEEEVESNILYEGLPNDFFSPYSSLQNIFIKKHKSSSKHELPKSKDTKGRQMTIPSTGDEALDVMFHDVLEVDLDSKLGRDVRQSLKEKLIKAGYKVDRYSDEEVFYAFQMYVNETLERIEKRPGALNCYDYIRLKDEVSRVNELAPIKEMCPTLMSIIKEVEDAEINNSQYPIRPFSFNNVKSGDVWGYQCLRILDEILYTTKDILPTSEIKNKIEEKCKQYGIEKIGSTSDVSLRKHFVTLRNMINVEYTGGFRKAYAKDVYVRAKNGHKYDRMINYNSPVTAFKLCFTLSEATKINKELNKVIEWLEEYHQKLNQESFGIDYPLLYCFANIQKYDVPADCREGKLNIIESRQKPSFYTLNYLPPVEARTKKQIEKIINFEYPRLITINKGEKKGEYIPLAINEQGLDWSLLARNVNSGLLYQISPAELSDNFSFNECQEQHLCLYSDFISEKRSAMIGLSDFYFDREKYFISVDLSKSGYSLLKDKFSDPLYPFFKQIHVAYDRSPRCVAVLDFEVYVNDDFFEEIYRLDRNKYILDIYSDSVDIKSEYFAFLKRKNYKYTYMPCRERLY